MARTPPLRTRSGGNLNRGRKRPCWTCPVFEVFFGGARGGGKTDGMLGEWASHADLHGKNAVGLMVRRERVQLLETIERSREIYGPLGAANIRIRDGAAHGSGHSPLLSRQEPRRNRPAPIRPDQSRSCRLPYGSLKVCQT
jgi:hypothetical protein